MPQDSRSRSPALDVPCDDCRSTEADGLRCACGSLLARYVAGAIELKCRRCKRTVLVPLDDSDPRRDADRGDDHAPR